uniref:Uncharacterized protein n=1 Tax=Anguilla anguilla TaxID=7936 RepID=A0A0E9V5I8_ANGAN
MNFREVKTFNNSTIIWF